MKSTLLDSSLSLVLTVFTFFVIFENTGVVGLVPMYTTVRSVFNEFRTGDIITCYMHYSFGSAVTGAEHAMLATSSRNVIHITEIYKSGGQYAGYIREEDFLDVAENKFKLCRIATWEYDRSMFERGIKPMDETDKMVSKAKSDVGRNVYYEWADCNCQHWVTRWRYGSAYSIQSNALPSIYCPIFSPGYFGPSANAAAYAKSTQVGSKATASVFEGHGGVSFANHKISVLSAGAEAEAGLEYTGVGVKASLSELEIKLGKHVGVSTGLNLDTNIGAGRDGASFQVAGIGFRLRLSKSKGSKTCIFGICLHFG